MAVFKGTNSRMDLHIPMINQPVFGAIYAHAGTQVSIEAKAMNWTEITKDWDNSEEALTTWKDVTHFAASGENGYCPVCFRFGIKVLAGDNNDYYHDISSGSYMTCCVISPTGNRRWYMPSNTIAVMPLPDALARTLALKTDKPAIKNECTCDFDTVVMITGCKCGGK